MKALILAGGLPQIELIKQLKARGITTVLAMQPKRPQTPGPCIGCGRCAEVCHAGLLPYEIVRRHLHRRVR